MQALDALFQVLQPTFAGCVPAFSNRYAVCSLAARVATTSSPPLTLDVLYFVLTLAVSSQLPGRRLAAVRGRDLLAPPPPLAHARWNWLCEGKRGIRLPLMNAHLRTTAYLETNGNEFPKGEGWDRHLQWVQQKIIGRRLVGDWSA